MKFLFSALALTFSLSTLAAPKACSVQYKADGSKLSWTAFKTPAKVGVNGQFTKFRVKAAKASSVDELLKNATFEVDSKSVATNDKARDGKIFNFFFKKMAKTTAITGKVTKVNASDVEADFTINGETKKVVLTKKYDESTNTLTLSGALNVLDFGMKSNLTSLTKACEALHEGVTWPDVNIELVAMVPKTCK